MRHAPDIRRATPAIPLDDAELIQLGNAAFPALGAVLIGVSGGPDSMALMLLAARWRDGAGTNAPAIHVATVDHRLRTGSADEALWVAGQASAMGLRHHTLVWTGVKPARGHQQAARAARYALLADLAVRLKLDAHDARPVGIAVAHHLDDQAETLIMRLQRGSGLDGLAGMKPVRNHAGRPVKAVCQPAAVPEIRIVRPFLAIAKARLVATLRARSIPWLEDPSNASLDFERVRVRRIMTQLQDFGISSAAIATSAQRLARASEALDQLTEDLAGRILQSHEGAYASIAVADFDAAPAELRLRLVKRLLRSFGGPGEPPRMTKLEKLVDRLATGRPMAATLSGCLIRRTPDFILANREPGRIGLPELKLRPGEAACWDGRFLVGAGPGWRVPIIVKALPAQTLTGLRQALRRTRSALIDLPRAAALSLPSFWDGPRLLAVGHPAFGTCGLALADAADVFETLSVQFVACWITKNGAARALAPGGEVGTGDNDPAEH